MINKFDEFIFEYSANEPFLELRKNKVAIFLFGAPGVGKSTFTNTYILPKLTNYRIFNPDDFIKQLIKLGREVRKLSKQQVKLKIKDIKKTIEELKQKNKLNINLSDTDIAKIIFSNQYVPNSYELLDRQLRNYIRYSNSSLVYDTTGNDLKRISEFTKLAKQNGYKVVFIKVISDIQSAIKGNLKRDRKVQLDYQYDSLKRAMSNNKSFLDLSPNRFYVYNRANSILYKYNQDNVLRKVKGMKEHVYESDQIRKFNDFNNLPFYGTHGITSTPGPYNDEIDEGEGEGEEPKVPRKTKGKIMNQKPIKKSKDKKLHFSIDQDDYKRYMKTKEPGKAFGVGT